MNAHARLRLNNSPAPSACRRYRKRLRAFLNRVYAIGKRKGDQCEVVLVRTVYVSLYIRSVDPVESVQTSSSLAFVSPQFAGILAVVSSTPSSLTSGLPYEPLSRSILQEARMMRAIDSATSSHSPSVLVFLRPRLPSPPSLNLSVAPSSSYKCSYLVQHFSQTSLS